MANDKADTLTTTDVRTFLPAAKASWNEKTRLSDAIMSEFTQKGCLRLALSSDEVRLFEDWHRSAALFFDLNPEIKKEYSPDSLGSDLDVGYTTDETRVKLHGKREGLVFEPVDYAKGTMFPDVKEAPDLNAAIPKIVQFNQELYLCLLAVLSHHYIKSEQHLIIPATENPWCRLRILMFDRQDGHIEEHIDTVIFTFSQATRAGLFVRKQDDNDNPLLVGEAHELIVLPGETLEIISGSEIKAPVHFVRSNEERQSLVFLAGVDPDALDDGLIDDLSLTEPT